LNPVRDFRPFVTGYLGRAEFNTVSPPAAAAVGELWKAAHLLLCLELRLEGLLRLLVWLSVVVIRTGGE
jgi:hypothetical protein